MKYDAWRMRIFVIWLDREVRVLPREAARPVPRFRTERLARSA